MKHMISIYFYCISSLCILSSCQFIQLDLNTFKLLISISISKYWPTLPPSLAQLIEHKHGLLWVLGNCPLYSENRQAEVPSSHVNTKAGIMWFGAQNARLNDSLLNSNSQDWRASLNEGVMSEERGGEGGEGRRGEEREIYGDICQRHTWHTCPHPPTGMRNTFLTGFRDLCPRSNHAHVGHLQPEDNTTFNLHRKTLASLQVTWAECDNAK